MKIKNHERVFWGCHSGGIKFKFYLKEFIEIWKCNCSICRMQDYEHLFIRHDDFNIIKGSEIIAQYSFGTKTAKHLFCKNCGINSFYQPRSHPDSYSINLKCAEGPPKIRSVVNFDGKYD